MTVVWLWRCKRQVQWSSMQSRTSGGARFLLYSFMMTIKLSEAIKALALFLFGWIVIHTLLIWNKYEDFPSGKSFLFFGYCFLFRWPYHVCSNSSFENIGNHRCPSGQSSTFAYFWIALVLNTNEKTTDTPINPICLWSKWTNIWRINLVCTQSWTWKKL